MTVRIRERPDSLNERIGTAAELTAKSNSEFPERDGHCAVPERLTVTTRAYFPGGFAGGAGAGAEGGAAAFGREATAPGLACSCARIAGVISIVGVV